MSNKTEPLKYVESILDVGIINALRIIFQIATYEELGFTQPGVDQKFEGYPPLEDPATGKRAKTNIK